MGIFRSRYEQASDFPGHMNVMKSNRHHLFTNAILLCLSLGASFALAEVLFRWAIFSDVSAFKNLRDPKLYANYFSEELQKLTVLLDPKSGRAQNPHPKLGWIGDASTDDLKHNKFTEINGRRPVLLYGDSFAQCPSSVECFEDILNKDPEFARDHYLLNYGWGNYGVDQIYLSMKYSLDHYDNPFVVLSVMTLDLDRALSRLRPIPKPYFEIVNDELVLHPPSTKSKFEYVKENPPSVKSYLFRFLYHKVRNWLLLEFPNRFDWLRYDDRDWKEKVIRINEKILEAAIQELESRHLDYVVLVFHPHWRREGSFTEELWRDKFLKDFLDGRGIPYIWSKSIILDDAKKAGQLDIAKYIIRGDGHPTELYNRLIAGEIKKHVLLAPKETDLIETPRLYR